MCTWVVQVLIVNLVGDIRADNRGWVGSMRGEWGEIQAFGGAQKKQ